MLMNYHQEIAITMCLVYLSKIIISENDKLFIVGAFGGREKQKPLDKYLEDYIQEVEQLHSNGITYNVWSS